MKGFQNEDKGLFTFYREQAEQEEELKAQKRERARMRKLKHELEKKKNEEKEREEEEKNKLKISLKPSMPLIKQNYTERAKKYIRDLEYGGKIMTQRSSKNSQKQFLKEFESMNFPKKEEIFMKKKYQNFKYHYAQLQDKEALEPKQFNSEQIFIKDSDLKKSESENHSLMKAKESKLKGRSSDKLPNINISSVIDSKSEAASPIKNKKSMIYYNPKDILMNNQKFKITEEFRKSPKVLPNNNTESILQILRKFK